MQIQGLKYIYFLKRWKYLADQVVSIEKETWLTFQIEDPSLELGKI